MMLAVLTINARLPVKTCNPRSPTVWPGGVPIHALYVRILRMVKEPYLWETFFHHPWVSLSVNWAIRPSQRRPSLQGQ
jgi:hypothetical protein